MLLILTVALGPAGCSFTRTSTVARGTPDAHQIVVRPFVIASDRPLDQGDAIVRELLQLRTQIQTTLELPPIHRQIEIYIFDDRTSYDQFMRTNYPELPDRRAFFIAQDGREVVYTFWSDRVDEDVRHEACHALVHAALGNLPLWLDEGLAEYFETPGRPDGVNARHAAELNTAISNGWRPGLTRLEAITDVAQMQSSDYRESWAWVHFLLHGTRDGRRELLAYLEPGRSRDANHPLSSQVFRGVPQADSRLISHVTEIGSIRQADHQDDKRPPR
jgi:hypothetical protein